MAKKACGHFCPTWFGVLVLVVGVLFLLRDFLVWDFWNISWYTAAFLLIGLTAGCSSGCPECKKLKKKKS